MKNILSVCDLSDGRVKTEIIFIDGSSIMEIHRQGLSDAKVLYKLQEKKFYQHFPGVWEIIFPAETHIIQRPSFDLVIGAAQEYIFNRDNSIDYSGFC